MAKLKITFKNNSSQTGDNNPVHIGFVPAKKPTMAIKNLKNGQPLASVYDGMPADPEKDTNWNGTWYTLSDFATGIEVSAFSGRIYVCYGTPWTPHYDGYEPAQTSADKNFFWRFDKMEFTFTGDPADVADLTSIDYWAIPMSLETYMDPATGPSQTPVQTSQGLLNGTKAQAVFDKLNALTSPPQSGLALHPPGGGKAIKPIPAVVPGAFKTKDKPKNAPTFARVIGPSSYPNAFPTFNMGMPITPYLLFEPYLIHLWQTFGPQTEADQVIKGLGKGVIARIKGTFSGVGPDVPPSGPQAKQGYDYTAYISDNLDIQLQRNGSPPSNNDQYETLCYRRGDILNPAGAYGGNCPYYVGCANPIVPQNDIYGWMTADLFCGLNIGAIGSEVKYNGTSVGQMPSQEWFMLPLDKLFENLQPDHTFYNPWANTMTKLSDAYNFAYSDRFDSVLVSLNPATVNRLQIVLEDDKVNPGS